MDKSEIVKIAEEISEKFNLRDNCNGGTCTFKNEHSCCVWGVKYKIEEIITKGINEGLRSDASKLPDNPTDKAKYNVQLQHDAHNMLDRLSDILYNLDKYNKESKAGTVSYVTAEYLRSGIKDLRHTLNELYLNNKL